MTDDASTKMLIKRSINVSEFTLHLYFENEQKQVLTLSKVNLYAH